MIKYACPKCRESLQAPEERIGGMHPCPKCGAQVQVPLTGSKDKTGLWIGLGILAGLLVLAVPLCIVVCLAAISVLGTNANTTFQTVGSSIGASGS